MDRWTVVIAIAMCSLTVVLLVLALFMPPHNTRVNRADPASHRVRTS
jgi:hypothetical protein